MTSRHIVQLQAMSPTTDCNDKQTLAVSMSCYSPHSCCAGSYESILHRINLSLFALNLPKGNEELQQALKGPKIERIIGVIYLPETERYRSAIFLEAAGRIMCYVSVDTDGTVATQPSY